MYQLPKCYDCGQVINNDYGPLYCRNCWRRRKAHWGDGNLRAQVPVSSSPQPTGCWSKPCMPTQPRLLSPPSVSELYPHVLPMQKQPRYLIPYKVERVTRGPCAYCNCSHSFVGVWMKVFFSHNELTLTEILCYECYVQHFHKKIGY